LGLPLTAKTPDHSSLSRIRQRLTPEVHEAVFNFVLQVLVDHDLLDADSVAVDGSKLTQLSGASSDAKAATVIRST
jgi:transposase